MKTGKGILAVIPARGGSKRLKNKNILPLAGKPLIAHTVAAALKSRYDLRVIVSTDSDEIAAAARRAGADVPFKRPARLATDRAATLDVLEHAVHRMERLDKTPYPAVVLLQPTSPLRKAADIDRGLDLFFKRKADVVFGICPFEHSPYWAFTKKKDGALRPFAGDRKVFTMRSQDLEQVYRLNGMLYVYRKEVVERTRPLVGPRSFGLEMDPALSFDIDTREDLERARRLMRERTCP